MRWIALHLPTLPLEAFCATLPLAGREAEQDAARPVALISAHRVQQVNAAAAARGIRAGMQRGTAQALAADLVLAEADATREAAALRAVVHAALAFTPAVVEPAAADSAEPATVLLEVQASLRLFGGPLPLVRRLAKAIAPLGHRVHAASAPTAAGAALLARWRSAGAPATLKGSEALLGPHATQRAALAALLDRAPVTLLPAPREAIQAQMTAMGLHRLADLRAQPRSGLARRFGEGLLDLLDRAYGDAPEPQRWATLPLRFESHLELAAAAEHAEQLLHGAAVLLARLVAWAQARQVRIASFVLHCRHERARQVLLPPTEITVALAEPVLDAAHLMGLLRERLGRVELPAPTLDLLLRCHDVVAAPAPNGELFPTRASRAEGLLRLVERLRARLGDGQVQRLVALSDHRPEQCSRAVPLQGEGAQPALPALPPGPGLLLPGLPLHRPAWRLPEPLPLPQDAEGQPQWQGRPLRLLAGPERIETGWWDEHPVQRDYFIAEAAGGALVWLYRPRLPTPPGEPLWHLQGWFG
jgi:protein ImuB